MSPTALIILPLAFLAFGLGLSRFIQTINKRKREGETNTPKDKKAGDITPIKSQVQQSIPAIVGKSKTLVQDYFDVVDDDTATDNQEEIETNLEPSAIIIDESDLDIPHQGDWLGDRAEPESGNELEANDIQALSEAPNETSWTPEKTQETKEALNKVKNTAFFEELKASKAFQANQELKLLLCTVGGELNDNPADAQIKQEMSRFL